MAAGIRKTGGDNDDNPRSKPHVERHARRLRKFQEIFEGNDRERDDGDGDIEKQADHHASTVADLLVEGGSFPHRAAALQHLLHKPSGQALLARMSKAAEQTTAKETTMTTSHNELVQDIVKQYGIVALAKSMVQDQKSYGLDEPTFTQLATEHAKRIYSNDRPDVAFSKLYQSEESVRRACQIAKSMPFVADVTPLVVGGEANRGGDVNPNDPNKAIEQLKELGARRWPTASAAAQFEMALTAPENHVLARRAVPIPRATTSYPFPR